MMDEYITRNNVISAVCFGCNQEFPDEPCEPDACAIRKSIMALPTADVVPKSEADEIAEELSDTIIMKDELFDEVIKLRGELANVKAEVVRAFRQRMNDKMGKHTHLLGKEYVQRIMREVEKELTGEKDA